MDDKDRARLERAQRRASWPVEARRLEEQEELELIEGDAAELIGMVRELTLTAWAMSGQPMPRYSREQTPGRVMRRSRES